MKSTIQLFLVLTYVIIANFTHATPLIGTEVRDATSEEFPNVVSIGMRVGGNIVHYHLCTGTLISHRHVLTAAHCFFKLKKPKDIVVIAGDANLHDGKPYDVEKWITYDEWMYGDNSDETDEPDNDLAIITLRKRVPNIEPADVLKIKTQDLSGSVLRMVGWGRTEDETAPSVMRTAAVCAITHEECEELLQSMEADTDLYVNYFCSRVKPYALSSVGDSGGPVFNAKGQVMAVLLGAYPPEEKLRHHPKELVYQKKLNYHINLHNYRLFIDCLTLNAEACELQGEE